MDITEIITKLDEAHPGNSSELIRLYALLVLTTGVKTGRKEVHDAWWLARLGEDWAYGEVKDNEKKTSPYLAPLETISEEIQSYDDPYVDTIVRIAGEI